MVSTVKLQPVGGAQGDCGDCAARSARGGAEGARLELQALTDTDHAELCPSCDWELQGTQELGSQALPSSPSNPGFHSCTLVGAKSVLVWSKGSGLPRQWSSDRVEEIAKGHGIQAAMYINFCEFDDCNNATSSDATLGHFHFECM